MVRILPLAICHDNNTRNKTTCRWGTSIGLDIPIESYILWPLSNEIRPYCCSFWEIPPDGLISKLICQIVSPLKFESRLDNFVMINSICICLSFKEWGSDPTLAPSFTQIFSAERSWTWGDTEPSTYILVCQSPKKWPVLMGNSQTVKYPNSQI